MYVHVLSPVCFLGSRVCLFLVGELLGYGSFGKVYEGTHIFDDRIKVKHFY